MCDPGVFFGCGLVFEVQPGIGERTLYQFTGAPDGMGPDGPLIRDAVGNLYGTTGTGGINSAQCGGAYAGCGTIYRLSKTGKEMIIHRFRGSDGDGPSSSLMENASGTIVGTTLQGGQWNNGVVYTIGGYVHPSLVLHSFNGSDGSFPEGGLTLASSGNFFGTTNGGDFYQGNVFEMTPNGQETILVSFTGRNGAGPTGTLVADKAGNLYGVAATGGARLQGEVFRVTP
ncbi:MAG TPA: choice-of-anchor tandem repeat GloVer-containing protein [Candidatus Eremiobacteraceae bacterium]|nr:choice-of-anchor tandem repeat GloVer-containing protein [Candidatus Eremiobacteraceae bacterium]